MTATAALPAEGPSAKRTRVLIVTADYIGVRMAGPAIRVWNMATRLAESCDVRIVSWVKIERQSDTFGLHFVHETDDRAMAVHEEWADVIIVQGNSLRMYPSVAATKKIVVADLYDPFHLEQLEQNKHQDAGQWNDEVTKAVSLINEQLERADCILCASERQQTLWLGALSAAGRINPATYTADPTFESFVRIVPFGLPSEAPVQTRSAIKGAIDGIAADDKVLIWGGGIYEWFDPVTLVRAMGRVVAEHPEVKLFFMSARHFNPDVPEMRVLGETMAVADELGLTDRHVFFNETWVDYEDRVNYLLDADAGVSTHPVHLETRFSFRTRTLDYLWSGLPIVTTDGDSFADLVRAHELGVVVPPSDPQALADAIVRILFDDEFRARAVENAVAVRESFTWGRVLEPLVDFCRNPVAAPDHPSTRTRSAEASGSFDQIIRSPRGPARDLALLRYYLRQGGLGLARRKIAERRKRRRRH